MKNSYSDILVSYTKRLISTSSRSRTIFFGKDNGYVLDLHSYLKFLDYPKLLKFLSGATNTLVIEAPKFNYSKAYDLFSNYHNNKATRKDVLDVYPTFTEADFLTIHDSIPNDIEYTKIYNKYDKVNKKLFKQLSKINDNNNSIKKESGKDDLYIGYPYIEGQFNDEKMVRAPLVLHKIQIEESANKITLTNENIRILNPVFVMSYLVENDKKYRDHLDFEILEDNYLDIAKLILEKIGIEVTWESNIDTIEKLVPCTKKEFKLNNNLVNNRFNVKPNICLGIFPLSNKKIYDDVKELSMDEENNNMLNNFYDSSSEFNVFEQDVEDIDEANLKYITTLDYSQKKTLTQAIEENHIIQGPPGTGKSQVIANIVANLLIKQKKVLVCSEKRTATDVIYNRLGKLSSFALLLHDQIAEKEYFYQAINQAITTVKNNIEAYKQNHYDFVEDKYIENFFSDSKKYTNIVNKDYYGLTFEEVLKYKNIKCCYSTQMKAIRKQVTDIKQLANKLYDYSRSEEYKLYKTLAKEANKEFYKKYNLTLDDPKIYLLHELEVKLKEISNNYVINTEINNLIYNTNLKISFLKKLFLKNQKLTPLSIDFIKKSGHNFSVFNGKIYDSPYSQALITLKVINNLNDEQIAEEYKSYVARLADHEIDYSFINEYTSTYDENKRKTFLHMEEKTQDSIEFICRSVSADIKEQLSKPIYEGRIQQLLGEANKKRKKPVKTIIDEYFDILQVLFPVWIMTPDVVSAIIPLKKEIFDKAIFDEASQLFIEKAIPTIARSKSIVICGDSKQLRPTLFFESRYEDDSEDIENIEQESAISETSLLDYATSTNKYKTSMLKYHYRCNHKELINFSSYAFYNGELTYANKNNVYTNMPLETINVSGTWDGKTNKIEAERVVELVKEIILNRKNNETIGIVTLNIHQRDLIAERLDEVLGNDKEVGAIFNKEKERKNPKNNEDESIFIKNLEGVQGDERDIIIFSIAYSKNSKGNIGSSLGELQRIHGENRLNVAISRAKTKIYIIKSFLGDELEINEDNRGPYYFKKYLQYADYLNSDSEDNANQLLFNLAGEKSIEIAKEDFTNFEQEIYNFIDSKIDKSRYKLISKILIGSFKVDMVIYDTMTYQYKLGIECSGNKNYYNYNEVTNNIYKQRYLDVRGWNIYWLWLSDYLLNKEQTFITLNELIEEFTLK